MRSNKVNAQNFMGAWEDIRVPISAIRVPGSKAPTWTAYKGSQVLGFAYQSVAGNEEEVYFVCQVPHAYRLGSDLYPHVHWTPETDDDAAVRWGFSYSWIDINGDFPSETTIYKTQLINGNTDKHIMTSFDQIDGSGISGVSSMLLCKLFRNSSHAEDTFDDVAYLAEFDFHFIKDSNGSTSELSK